MERLPLADVRKSFELHAQEYPPILSAQQAAVLSHYALSTLKRKVSEGHFRKSVKPGRPLLFYGDYFVQELMTSGKRR